jgi:hypothetical protein
LIKSIHHEEEPTAKNAKNTKAKSGGLENPARLLLQKVRTSRSADKFLGTPPKLLNYKTMGTNAGRVLPFLSEKLCDPFDFGSGHALRPLRLNVS